MAASLKLNLFSLYCILLATLFATMYAKFSEKLPIPTKAKPMEKMTNLHFYFHDTVSGRNATAVRVVQPANTSVNGFGAIFMMDDPLTEGPENDSKLVGRAQGIYGVASQHDIRLLMAVNFAFLEGEYNGSVLSILGTNPILEMVREMPIVGGSGIFRHARGYALARTVWFNEHGDAVVEYNVSVVHL